MIEESPKISIRDFINKFRCYQCGWEPKVNYSFADGASDSQTCNCKRTSKITITLAQALLFNVTTEYAWIIFVPSDENDPILFYLYKQPSKEENYYYDFSNGFLVGKHGAAAILHDKKNQLMETEDVPDFIYLKWSYMADKILMLDVFK